MERVKIMAVNLLRVIESRGPSKKELKNLDTWIAEAQAAYEEHKDKGIGYAICQHDCVTDNNDTVKLPTVRQRLTQSLKEQGYVARDDFSIHFPNSVLYRNQEGEIVEPSEAKDEKGIIKSGYSKEKYLLLCFKYDLDS